MKTCRKCGAVLVVGENWNRTRSNKSDYMCGICAVIYMAQYRDTNRTAIAKQVAGYKASHKEEVAEMYRAWQKANPGRCRAIGAKRRSAKLQRTPVWADHLVISMIYEDCPAGHQVDHIYPLQGDTVSGLHVPWNLQYLTKSENCSKGNRYVA